MFKPQSRQFVMIENGDMFSPNRWLGGIGSTVTEWEGRYYVFFGLGEEGYIGNVGRFEIEERVKENLVVKKKRLVNNNGGLMNGEMMDWKEGRRCDMDSSDSSDHDPGEF